MDEKLKQLFQNLGNAINASLSESESIAYAIGEIKAAGYDVFLVLEATIGFNKREDAKQAPSDQKLLAAPAIKVRFTKQDEEFLKSLKITPPEEDPDSSQK